MTGMINFSYEVWAKHVDSFKELMERAGQPEGGDLVFEALTFYDFYESEILGKKDNMLLVYDPVKAGEIRTKATPINDEKTADHKHLTDITFSIPASDLPHLPNENQLGIFSARITKALILYEHIIEARAKNQLVSLYNEHTHTMHPIDVVPVAFVPPSHPAMYTPAARGPYLN